MRRGFRGQLNRAVAASLAGILLWPGLITLGLTFGNVHWFHQPLDLTIVALSVAAVIAGVLFSVIAYWR